MQAKNQDTREWTAQECKTYAQLLRAFYSFWAWSIVTVFDDWEKELLECWRVIPALTSGDAPLHLMAVRPGTRHGTRRFYVIMQMQKGEPVALYTFREM